MEVQIVEYSQTAAALAALRQKYEKVLFPVETTAGMKDALGARKELRDIRVGLEKMRKEIKAPALERCRLIDEEAKTITAQLEALEKPIDGQIKAEEARKEREKQERERLERERIETIRKKVEGIRRLPAAMSGESAAEIAAEIEALEQFNPGDEFAEFIDDAEAAKANALDVLRAMHERQAAQEAAAEAARLEAERLAAERAELERQRAEAAAAAQAAQAAAKAEAERLAAERAAFEAEQAEFRRRQSELMQAEEAKRAEQADKAMAAQAEAAKAAAYAASSAVRAQLVSEQMRTLDQAEDEAITATAKEEMIDASFVEACDMQPAAETIEAAPQQEEEDEIPDAIGLITTVAEQYGVMYGTARDFLVLRAAEIASIEL